MKEISIEEKAKRYDEAIELAQRFYNNCVAITKEGLEYIFPELKESEDERIRKEIIDYFVKDVGLYPGEDRKEHKWLRWLEKQGEQNLAFIEKGKWYVCIRTSYKPNGKDFIEGKTYYAKEDYNIIGECGEVDIATDNPEEFFRSATEEETNDIIKNFVNKQKPAEWSEEDEEMIDSIIGNIKCLYSIGSCDNATIEKKVNWLKSLRPQNRWKPSDEHIEALEHFVRNIGESGYASPYDNNTKLLYSLLEQLKKLKE